MGGAPLSLSLLSSYGMASNIFVDAHRVFTARVFDTPGWDLGVLSRVGAIITLALRPSVALHLRSLLLIGVHLDLGSLGFHLVKSSLPFVQRQELHGASGSTPRAT